MKYLYKYKTVKNSDCFKNFCVFSLPYYTIKLFTAFFQSIISINITFLFCNDMQRELEYFPIIYIFKSLVIDL